VGKGFLEPHQLGCLCEHCKLPQTRKCYFVPFSQFNPAEPLDTNGGTFRFLRLARCLGGALYACPAGLGTESRLTNAFCMHQECRKHVQWPQVSFSCGFLI